MRTICRIIIGKVASFFQFGISEIEIEKVYIFFSTFEGLRSTPACSRVTGLNQARCEKIRRNLYKERRLGLYFFEAGVPPQKYMKKYILEKFNTISNNSKIVELGPGQFPVFDYSEYDSWLGVDKNYDGRQINFKELQWSKNKYPTRKIIGGGLENLSQCLAMTGIVGSVDLVVASHVYEHAMLPIQSLIEINRVLRPGGILVLFVPDGFTEDINTKDPTHTLYLNQGMIKEFFYFAGGYTDIEIKVFRPNADLVITAIKL